MSPRAKGSVEGEEASALGVGWAGGSRAHRPSLVGHGAELLLLPESRGKGLRGSEREGVTLVSRDDPSGDNVEGLCYSGKWG